MSAAPSPRLVMVLVLCIVAMIPLSGWGILHGWSTIQTDRRMTTGGLTVEGRITAIDTGSRGTVSNPASARADEVRHMLAGAPERQFEAAVGRALLGTPETGQAVTPRMDPENPERHMLDRGYEVFRAWLFVAGFGALMVVSPGLAG